jgi:hypothetical protein
MQWRDDTTLPSRGLYLRPIDRSSECSRMTGVGQTLREPAHARADHGRMARAGAQAAAKGGLTTRNVRPLPLS